jgi:hypothetical protein
MQMLAQTPSHSPQHNQLLARDMLPSGPSAKPSPLSRQLNFLITKKYHVQKTRPRLGNPNPILRNPNPIRITRNPILGNPNPIRITGNPILGNLNPIWITE